MPIWGLLCSSINYFAYNTTISKMPIFMAEISSVIKWIILQPCNAGHMFLMLEKKWNSGKFWSKFYSTAYDIPKYFKMIMYQTLAKHFSFLLVCLSGQKLTSVFDFSPHKKQWLIWDITFDRIIFLQRYLLYLIIISTIQYSLCWHFCQFIGTD